MVKEGLGELDKSGVAELTLKAGTNRRRRDRFHLTMERHANIQSGDEVCSVRTFRGVTDGFPLRGRGQGEGSRLSVTSIRDEHLSRIRANLDVPWVRAVVALQTAAMAWGPHPAITQAALDALGTNHPLKLSWASTRGD